MKVMQLIFLVLRLSRQAGGFEVKKQYRPPKILFELLWVGKLETDSQSL